MKIFRSERKIRYLLLGGSALSMSLAMPGAVPAQETGSAASGQEPVEEIVITGSRILQRDAESDSPLMTVTNEDLTETGAISIDQQLQELPQFAPGSNQFNSSGSTEATPTESPGIATANLRDLGSNRTLVLVDGRRWQPANASLAVDLNTIPTLAIQSVEVITGGAGATYGADAVAGVVNFRLYQNFEGVRVDASYGITQQGDGQEYSVESLMGTNFDDGRGNVMIGMSYKRRHAAHTKNYDFFTRAWSDPQTPGGNTLRYPNYSAAPAPVSGISQDAVNEAFSGAPAGDVSPSGEFYFQPGATTGDASIFSRQPGAVSGDPAVGYTGPLQPNFKLSEDGVLQQNTTDGYLSLPMESYSGYLRGHYEVAENIEWYMQGTFQHKELTTRPGTYVVAFNQWSVDIPRDGQHPVPDSLETILDSRNDPDDPWTLDQSADNLGLGLTELHNTTTTYQMLTGFRGDIGIKDWTYDVFISHGVTNQEARYDGYIDGQSYQELISLPNYGANQTFRDGRLGREASCTSGLNPFLDQPVSQDCADIISPDIDTGTDITQDMAELNLQGGLFDLPAGELRGAVGTAWRENKFDYEPDKGISTSNITSFTAGLFDTTETHGKVSVKEIYGELLVPVVSDQPFIQSLELNTGIRYSDYNNIGGVTTWKMTGDWAVNNYLKFRGGYQRANRAPNVAELFQPPVFTVVDWPDHDPCSSLTRASYGNVPENPDREQVQELCTALNGGNTEIGDDFVGNVPFFFPLGRDLTQGNADLESEKAKTWTFGTVVNSPFESAGLRDINLTVDFYQITIDGAISPASTQVVYQECFNDLGNNPDYDPNYDYCQRILREPNGEWIATIAQYENLGKIETAGFDATLNWGMAVPSIVDGPGRVYANVLFNYLDKYEIQNFEGGPTFDYAGSVGRFRWKLNTTVGYSFGPASIDINWRHLPSAKNEALVTNPEADYLDTKSFDVFDLSARWSINESLRLRAGIENVFNTEPNRVGVLPGETQARGSTTSDYDQLGRRFYFGVGYNF